MNFLIADTASVEVLSAYYAPQGYVAAVAEGPGWHVIGGFFLQKTTKARLDVFGLVSEAGLTCTVRLFDLEDLEPVSGVVTITSQTSARALGSQAALVGNRNYQIQAQCVGGGAETDFAVLHSVTLTD